MYIMMVFFFSFFFTLHFIKKNERSYFHAAFLTVTTEKNNRIIEIKNIKLANTKYICFNLQIKMTKNKQTLNPFEQSFQKPAIFLLKIVALHRTSFAILMGPALAACRGPFG